jgi:tetratricopeptide (TPR) repeat protein
MSGHIPEDILIEYADEPRSHPEAEEHLSGCRECRDAVAFYLMVNAELREEETWAAEQELRTEVGQQAVRDFAERIAVEDAEAHRLLDRIVDSPYRFARAKITERKGFRTGGVVRLLCEAILDQIEREPLYAMELAQAAQAIAEALPDNYYPSSLVFDLRGRAWKDYATVCHDLARYEAGLDALVRAERAYRHLPDSGPGTAAVNLSRAGLLWKLQRYAEALPYARAAAGEYQARRDTRRFIQAQEVEAVILQRTGEHLRAREIYERAFDAAAGLDDLDMKARAARNLGINYREAGDLGKASEYFVIALQLYEALGQDAWIARTRWSIARLPLVAGLFSEAARGLRVAIRALELKGLVNDVADAKLDLAEALLMLGDVAEVEYLCGEVAHFYHEKALATGALMAATFLREVATKRALRREDIQHVRRYLVELRENPDLLFAPPRRRV